MDLLAVHVHESGERDAVYSVRSPAVNRARASRVLVSGPLVLYVLLICLCIHSGICPCPCISLYIAVCVVPRSALS